MSFEELGYSIDCKISSIKYWFRKNVLRQKPKPIDPGLKPLIDIMLAIHKDELLRTITQKNVLYRKLTGHAEEK